MARRIRFALLLVAVLMVGVLEAGCPPVVFGYTTTYRVPGIICHGEGCESSGPQIVGECTLSCDGSYSCWGNNNCGGLTSCSTTYEFCGDCTPDY